jgi:holin-like protein
MPIKRISALSGRRFRSSRLLQILLLLGFWLLGELVCRGLRLPVPGAIVGLFLLIALLATGRVSILTVRKGARWFIAEMLLFFVPAVLAVLDHRELLGMLGLKILAVILLGTLTVMVVTAATIDICYRFGAARGGEADVGE